MTKIFCLVLVACVAQVLGKPNPIDPHIVGGTPANEGEFPFAVSLKALDEDLLCGGAIISKRHILTAAACLQTNPDVIEVGVGSVHLGEQKIYKIEKAMLHKDYKPWTFMNDIGIIKLKKDLEFSRTVQPILFDHTGSMDDKTVTVMGWGKTKDKETSSLVLMHVPQTAVPNQKCQTYPNETVLASNICTSPAKNSGACFGDTGGPLVYKENNQTYLVGVASSEVSCEFHYSDVFARISSYVDWINENMKK